MCNVCYSTCYDINVKCKKKTCQYACSNAKKSLIEYYQILETKPELINSINHYYINKYDE